jgi:hypothetical protein
LVKKKMPKGFGSAKGLGGALLAGPEGLRDPLGAASDSAPRNSFHFTISYCKLRAVSGAKGGQSYAHLFGTAREIEMGRRRSAAPLKKITDRGIDEVQRVTDFLRPLELVDFGGFYFIVAQGRPT